MNNTDDRIIDRRRNWEARAEMAVLKLPREELGTYDKLVYVSLCGFASHEGTAFPSVSVLAEVASCSERWVFKSLRKLEDVGLIVRHPQFRENGGQKSTLYEIFGFENYTPPCVILTHPPEPRSYITTLPKITKKNTFPLREMATACAAPQDAPPSPSATEARRRATPAAIPPSSANEEKAETLPDVESGPEAADSDSDREIYSVEKAPESMKQTAAYLLLRTGRSKLSGAEVDALLQLDAKHYPAFLQKHIDELVLRFEKNGKSLKSLNFCYLLGSLKNFAPTIDFGKMRQPRASPPSAQNLIDLDEYAFLQSDEYRQRQIEMLKAEGFWHE